MVKITTHKQMRRLVELMEENEHLAKNYKRGVSSIASRNVEWESLAEDLNSLGPPLRNGKEWQKVWCDAKFKVKQKLVYNKKEVQATGGGTFKQKYLNDVDEAIIRILSLNDVVSPSGYVAGGSFYFASGKPVAVTSSTPTKSKNDSAAVKIATLTPSTNESPTKTTATPVHEMLYEMCFEDPTLDDQEEHTYEDENVRQKTKRNKKENVFQKMLEKQTQVQENLFTSIDDSLKNIRKNFKENVNANDAIKNSLITISGYLKESSRYNRKNFYVQQEQLEMHKVQMERDERQRLHLNNLKFLDLEIRKRQLDIEERKMELLQK